MAGMTNEEFLLKISKGPIQFRTCSICDAPQTLRFHENMAAIMLDTRCNCGPYRMLGPDDVATWGQVDLITSQLDATAPPST